MTIPTTRTHYHACMLCEAICGLAIETDGERILSIRGDAQDPLGQGHICPKGVALQDLHADPDRLRQPVRRTPSGWETMDWDEALDETARAIARIQAAHGADAVGLYMGNPSSHQIGIGLQLSRLRRTLKTRNAFSATSIDQLPHHMSSLFMFGHGLMFPIPDIDRTDHFLIIGGNPAASNGSIMTAPGMRRRMKAVQKRGGRVVVVDPRRTETAKLADAHHFIRPGTDPLLLLGLLHTLFDEGLAAPGRLAAFTSGWAEIEALVAAYPPERVAPPTGMTAAEIRQMARDFAAADSAVCYGRVGPCQQASGSVNSWLINVINIVTGNCDRPGGAMFTQPAIDLLQMVGPGRYGRWRTRVRGLPEVRSELPVAALAEEILTEGEGQIKAMMLVAGNPVLSTPAGRRLDQAFRQLDFMVAIDFYINESTRHAHIILPPTGGLEHANYDLIFHAFAVRNTARYSTPLFDPAPGTMGDYEILDSLLRRLEGDAAQPQPGLEQTLDYLLRTGPYGQDGLSLEALKQAPHGVDLGPLQPCLPERLFTADKRIDLAPGLFMQAVADVEDLLDEGEEPNDGFDLRLIGRRHLRSNNSWMHNSPRLVKGPNRCTVMLHPDDAAARGLADGAMAVVSSRVGSIEIEVEVSDEVMPGVVSIPHGWGHGRNGVRLGVARQHAGVSVNDITDPALVERISGQAAVNGMGVRVKRR